MGVTLQGRMTRKAPVRTEPHPTFPVPARAPKKGSVNNSTGYALDSTFKIGVTSGSGRCRRLSANHCFVGEPISSRGRLLRLFIRAAMAGRFLLSQLHQRSSLEIIAGSLALFWMSQASFRSGWNRFPRHTSANENLVSSDVVYHQLVKMG